jgi:hypothetical protein
VCGERTDDDLVILLADPAKAGNSAEIDEQLWVGKSELHQRKQTVPSGEKLCLFSMIGQPAHGLF